MGGEAGRRGARWHELSLWTRFLGTERVKNMHFQKCHKHLLVI